ncbi:MAG: hypothetical protein WEF50_09110 [Myxococcota bacterium]
MTNRRTTAAKMTVASLLLVAGSIIAFAVAKQADQPHSLGDHELAIPPEYLLEGELDRWVDLIPGTDVGSRGVLLRVPAREIAAHVPTYKIGDPAFQVDIIARLVALTPKELREQLDPHRLSDLWFQRGEYENAIMQQDRNRRLLKVFRRAEYPRSWALVSNVSADATPLPDSVLEFWVAHCLDGPSSDSATAQHATCMTFAMLGDLMIEFDIPEQNVDAVDAVRRFMVELVAGWTARDDG